MTRVFIQEICVVLAGAALYAMWRRVAGLDRVFGLVAGLGLVGRALLGQVLFWVSWLDLIPRGLHYGGGIWFFAADADHYMNTAVLAAREGPLGIVSHAQGSTATTYLELLSAFALLFGGVASIGLLLNLFCYMGICTVIAQCSKGIPEARFPALFSLVAVTFYPAGVLWSLQPLKDTLSHFLLVALAGSALLWQRAWRREGSMSWIGWACFGMVVSLYGTAGTRWYLGLAVLGAAGVFLFLMVVTTRTRRLALVGSSAVLFIVLSRVFLASGGTLVPMPLRRALTQPIGYAPVSPAEGRRTPSTIPQALPGDRPREEAPAAKTVSNAGSFATSMVFYAQEARGNFARSGGATEIQLPGRSSATARWGGGVVATLLPHFVIEHLSFVKIGGGRGLFWFADVDTIVFDAVVFTAIFLILRRWRLASLSNPAFWLVMLTAIFIAVPLLYAISNFGALLRFRGMMYVLFAIAPLVAFMSASRSSSPSDPQ